MRFSVEDGKNSTKKVTHDHDPKGLQLSYRKLSFIATGGVVAIGVVFIIGYMVGQRYIIEQFTDVLYNESFSDHIYTSILSTHAPSFSYAQKETKEVFAQTAQIKNNVHKKEQIESVGSASKKEIRYYAHLIGFRTEKAAHRWVNKLKKRGFQAEVREKVSKTTQKKTVTWYQVVTPPFYDKNILINMVDVITRQEKLRDPRIVTC